MALVNVTNVEVLNNPARFTDNFEFVITIDCIPPGIPEDEVLEWKLVYVGNPEDESYDQELEVISVGPVMIGKCKFPFSAPPPDPSRIPREHLIGSTCVLLTGTYMGQEFIRVGYYVHNEIDGFVASAEETVVQSEEVEEEDGGDEECEEVEVHEAVVPSDFSIEDVIRNIDGEGAIVTRSEINWGGMQQQQQQSNSLFPSAMQSSFQNSMEIEPSAHSMDPYAFQ